jgi:lipoprotein NlpI
MGAAKGVASPMILKTRNRKLFRRAMAKTDCLLFRFTPFIVSLLIWASVSPAMAAHPVPQSERDALRQEFTQREKLFTDRILGNPKEVALYSSRGDTRLFLAKFAGAVADYEKMIALDPTLDVSHWRLGIAYYYVGKFDKAAHQFEIYHTYDNVDRENGIWRFMSQTRAAGAAKARKGLLEYKKSDRPPYPWLYALYAGTMKPEQVFVEIKKAEFDERYETRVSFHADLYLGIHYELNGNPAQALAHLRKATANAYGRATGTYMWQVARVHHNLLAAKLASR